MEKQRRFTPDTGAFYIEKRDDGKEYFTVKGITFNTWSNVLGGWMKEKISPRALDGCDLSDVLNKFNHDINCVLGRTPDTLTLEIRQDGLYGYTEYDPLDSDHVRVRRKIEKKIVRGSSFEFTVADKGSVWTTEVGTNYELREVLKIAKLYDIAPVINPAYEDTLAQMDKRSLDELKQEHDSYLAEQRQQVIESAKETLTVLDSLITTAETVIAEPRMAMPGKKPAKSSADTTPGEQFLADMIAHHQTGVDMATKAVADVENDEVKALAAGIVEKQLTEIDTMQDLLSTLYGVADPDAEQDAMEMGKKPKRSNEQPAEIATITPEVAAEHDRMLMELTQ